MKTHWFESTGEAYDACQCDDTIKDGDILVIADEQVVGVAWTWPFAVTDKFGHLHQLEPRCDLATFEGGAFRASVVAARELARRYGYRIDRDNP